MQVKLRLNKERTDRVREELAALGIVVDENADLILTEENYQEDTLFCKDGADTVSVPLEDVCYIEAVGHDVLVHTKENVYKTGLRLYRLEAELPPDRFIRISNGVIIARNAIRRIRPGLSCRFFLILTNGDAVDVTRTYYYKFKEFYGI